jgi:hypothetical protein
LIGCNAAAKLADPTLSDADYWAFAERLWRARVWDVTLAILDANREPCAQLAQHLHAKETVTGAKLRAALAQVRRVAL